MTRRCLFLCTLAILGLIPDLSGAASRITPAAAAARARERFEGDVLDVELDAPRVDEKAEAVYEVRLLTRTGVIIRVRLDAADGTFLEAAGDNLIPALRHPWSQR